MKRIAIAALALLALTVPTTASAGSSERIVANGGTAKFLHKGEILYVSDTIRDGAAMTAQLLDVTGGGYWFVTDSGADGTPRSVNVSIPENHKLKLRLCYTLNGENVQCSRWQSARA